MILKSFSRINEKLSAVAMGTWAIGGAAWGGDIEDKNSIAAIQASIDEGVNIVDTAPFYGAGHSEEITGEAVKGRRDKVLIATKCGLIQQGSKVAKVLTEGSIKAEVDLSLHRLGVDYIDIYQTHWPAQTSPAETYGAMQELRETGKIRYIGACNVDLPLLKEIDAICPLSFVQNEYSYLDRSAGDGVLEYCEENGIAFLAYGVLAGGFLTGKYKEMPTLPGSDARNFLYGFSDKDKFDAAQRAVEKFKAIAAKHNTTPGGVAMAWAAGKSQCVIPLAGAKRAAQAKQNADAGSVTLTAEEMYALESE